MLLETIYPIVPNFGTIEACVKWGYVESMRPLAHPLLNDISLEGILHALSDPVRVAIFAAIAGSQYSQRCAAFSNIVDRTVPKSTLSQHFKALREAGLIKSERSGVEMLNTSRCDEIETRFPGLIPAIVNAYLAQARFRSFTAEGEPGSDTVRAEASRKGRP